jgi:hypothetical protein
MPRYNLIDDQDSDNLDSYFKEPDKPKTNESEIKPNTEFDIPTPVDTPREENPFEVESESDYPIQQENFDVPAPQEPVNEEESYIQSESDIKQPSYYEDYDDSKQVGINYKPIIIILCIVAVLIIGYFVVTKFILQSSEVEEVPDVKEPVKTEREIQRENLLKNVFAKNNGKINFLSNVNDFLTSDIKFSSILLYDNDLSIEVFSKSRDALAPFNLQIKNNPAMAGLVLSTTATRPGSKGGIFALYSTDTIPLKNSSPADSIQMKTASSFSLIATSQYGLSLISDREISTISHALFSIKRIEFQFTGADKNCWQFLTHMGTDNANYSIYKLNFLPTDQKSIARSTYHLNIILDFYL